MILTAICATCGLLRPELGTEWIEAARRGRALGQVDSGKDFMFTGVMVDAPVSPPCQRCAAKTGHVALVRAADAVRIGAYIARHLWRRS